MQRGTPPSAFDPAAVDNDENQLDAAAAGVEELLVELDESEDPDFSDDELDEDDSDDDGLDDSVLLLELPVLVFFPDSRLSVR